MPLQHGDILFSRLVFSGGVYDYTETVPLTPPSGGGVVIFNSSTGYPEPMAVSADMMTLLSSSDMDSMKSAAELIDSSSFTWANLGGKPTLFSGAYADLTGKPSLFDGTWASLSGKPSFATVATSGNYNDLSNKPTINSRVFTTPTFSGATTANILHNTRDTEVSYDFDATVTISLLAGQSVTATLRYADNSGMSTNVVTVSSQVASNSGVLNLTQTNTLKLSGVIPAGKYRQVTFSVTGSGATAPTTLKAGQEVTLP